MWDLYDKEGKRTFERSCPVSHAYCEWLSVKLMALEGVGVGGLEDGGVAVVKQDADVVRGHPGKEAVIS